MVEFLDGRCAFRPDAAAQKEGCHEAIIGQERPVELPSTATATGRRSVEQEIIDKAHVVFAALQVVFCFYGQCLDHATFHARCGQCLTHLHDVAAILVAMQLDEVETELIGTLHDFVHPSVDKDTDTLAPRGQIVGTGHAIARRLVPKDESHPVDAECLDCANVIGLAHTAYLD